MAKRSEMPPMGDMVRDILSRAEERSGKSHAALVKLTRESSLATRKLRTEWLMQNYGLGRVAANMIAAEAEGKATDYEDQEGLLDAMYAGPKAALRPIYDKLVRLGEALGPEFSLYQCAGQTTFKRNRQFAWVKPSTRTRADLGLALPGYQAGGRLLPITGTNDKDRVRLRIALESVDDVDDEVRRYLAKAYDLEALGKS